MGDLDEFRRGRKALFNGRTLVLGSERFPETTVSLLRTGGEVVSGIEHSLAESLFALVLNPEAGRQ